MTTPQPKISILMPSFNQAPYLEMAIRSVLTQNYPNKELILIDGGSTDGTVDIIKRYQSDLAYWVSESDRGQTHALNKALTHASGELIGWLNSDDYYLPGAFQRVVQAFENHPEIGLIHGDRIMVDEKSRVLGWTTLPPFAPASTGFIVCSETAFWRKSEGEKIQFDESLRFAMDLDFFCRLYRQSRFLKLDHYLGAFRCHAANKSSLISDVGRQETEALWKNIFPEFPDGWKKGPPANLPKSLLALVKNPLTITLPYLYRRLFIGSKK